MDEKRQRRVEIFNEWQVLGFITSFTLFVFAYQLQDAEWTKINGGVRMCMHALAAVAAVYCIYFTVALAVVWVTQNLLEKWLMIIYIKPLTRRACVKLERLFLKAFRPMLATILYIQFCFNWESLQAIEMHREIQQEQLAVDIMFSVIMGLELLFRLSDKAAICPYYWSKREVVENHYDNCLEWAYSAQNGGIIYDFCIRKLTPFVVIGLDYLIIRSMFFLIGH